MKKILCRAMGNDCFFVARGETEKEVLYKITAHIREVHTKEMNEMVKNMSQAEIKELILSKIKDGSGGGTPIIWHPPI